MTRATPNEIREALAGLYDATPEQLQALEFFIQGNQASRYNIQPMEILRTLIYTGSGAVAGSLLGQGYRLARGDDGLQEGDVEIFSGIGAAVGAAAGALEVTVRNFVNQIIPIALIEARRRVENLEIPPRVLIFIYDAHQQGIREAIQNYNDQEAINHYSANTCGFVTMPDGTTMVATIRDR